MIELDSKLLDQFKGYVVRKDVVRSVKGGANVPVFVLEYLLANSCSTDDEEKIQEGIENVKRVLCDHYVNPDEATLVQVKIREQGTYKIIDKISVRLERYIPLSSARYAPSSSPVLKRSVLQELVACSTTRNGLTYCSVVEATNLNQKV